MPDSAPWLKDFKEELENFPLCVSKDSVDAFVHALAYASRPAEFKPRQVVSSTVHDCLSDRGYESSFENLNHFDAQMESVENFLNLRGRQ